jgi:SAM-dependent methyltransferase
LNYPFLIDRLLKDNVKLDVLTLTPERHCFADRGVAYLYEDLRKIPIVDGHYDCVVCVSTLEHVGFNNEFFTQRRADVEHRPNDYLIACSEMFRVLRPEGQLLITVPFGKYQDVGAFQQFSDKEIGVLVDSMKGASQINVQYFRLRATGAWDIATADECSQCESVHWVMASKSERPKTFPVQPDKAASARAVACMQFVK